MTTEQPQAPGPQAPGPQAPGPQAQRRGRRIAMTASELDAFLAAERTCRIATNGTDGPHVTPLWFCWDGARLWLYSLTRSQRWADLRRDPRIAVVIDVGTDYFELRGAEISGLAEPIGEQPRTGEPVDELVPVEAQFAAKYFSADQMLHDGRHAWLRVTPGKIASWDFRKIPAAPPGGSA